MRAWPLLLFGAAAALPATAAGRWATYSNARYAFRICYPSDLLIPQGEADNGDGQTFRARDGAELRVFGSNNVLERSLAEEAREQARPSLGAKGRVTYRAAGRAWQVMSGEDGSGRLFYAKTLVRGDQFLRFQLRYPRTAAARYKPVVERLSACFGPVGSANR